MQSDSEQIGCMTYLEDDIQNSNNRVETYDQFKEKDFIRMTPHSNLLCQTEKCIVTYHVIEN